MTTLQALIALAPPANPGAPQPPFWVQMMPLVLLMVIFYFLLIRPQQKKARAQEELLKTLKRGDKVITSSGIVGVVVSIKDRTVSIRSEDTRLEVLKSSVSDVTERGSGSGDA